MSEGIKKAAVVYCSPAGTTRHAAGIIEEELKAQGISVTVSDLGSNDDGASVIEALKKEKTYLFIGSPVYANRPVPPVMEFLSKLPKNADALAVPFVTWGCVSSGIALYDMGKSITDLWISLIGAAKIPSVHSMMWGSDSPLGKNHPNAEDDKELRSLVTTVLKKSGSEEIPLADLAYQPAEVQAEMEKVTLAMAKGHMPKKEVYEQKCTECGTCAAVCPADAISFSPYPVFSDRCIVCSNCVKECPEDAIEADFYPLEDKIRGRAKQMNEPAEVKLFV